MSKGAVVRRGKILHNKIFAKLRAQCGASITYALLFLIVATMVSLVILSSALTSAKAVSSDAKSTQVNLTLSSLEKVFTGELNAKFTRTVKKKNDAVVTTDYSTTDLITKKTEQMGLADSIADKIGEYLKTSIYDNPQDEYILKGEMKLNGVTDEAKEALFGGEGLVEYSLVIAADAEKNAELELAADKKGIKKYYTAELTVTMSDADGKLLGRSSTVGIGKLKLPVEETGELGGLTSKTETYDFVLSFSDVNIDEQETP